MNRPGVQPLRRGSIFLVTLILAGGVVPRASGDGIARSPRRYRKIKFNSSRHTFVPSWPSIVTSVIRPRPASSRASCCSIRESGIAKGGENGPVLVSGDVEKSRLIQAIRWTDPDFVDAAKGKADAAADREIRAVGQDGRARPARRDGVGTGERAEDARPRRRPQVVGVSTSERKPPRRMSSNRLAKKKIDFFVLQELEAKQLSPSAQADPRTSTAPRLPRPDWSAPQLRANRSLRQRLLRPALMNKSSSNCSPLPQYGQRWGRYWLDVARYGEDNPTSEATNPPYPFAWRYRDWVIDAVNRDVPYNQFVTLQLAADLLPGAPRSDLAATGFLGAGPIYHKDGRLSKDVIENLYMDDWDERVDVVSRGILGLDRRLCPLPRSQVRPDQQPRLLRVWPACSRPPSPFPGPLPTSTRRPKRASWSTAQRLFYLSYVANLLRTEPGSKPGGSPAKGRALRRGVEQDRGRNRTASAKHSPDLTPTSPSWTSGPPPTQPNPLRLPAS